MHRCTAQTALGWLVGRRDDGETFYFDTSFYVGVGTFLQQKFDPHWKDKKISHFFDIFNAKSTYFEVFVCHELAISQPNQAYNIE
jgi:hypothetical protein